MTLTKKVAFALHDPSRLIPSEIIESGFNTLICGYQNLNRDSFEKLHKSGLTTWIEVGCCVGEDLWKKYPRSRPVIKGRLLNKLGPGNNKWYAGVIPTPEVIDDRLALIDTVLQTYKEAETIYLDFCRFPGRWEDGQGHSIVADNSENDIMARMNIISDFVEKVSKKCHKTGVNMGIFLTPYENDKYGQNLDALSHLCDFFSPMLYHKICKKPASWIGTRIHDYKAQLSNIIPVIQSLPEPVEVTSDEFAEALSETVNSRAEGIMVLSYEALSEKMKIQFRDSTSKPEG